MKRSHTNNLNDLFNDNGRDAFFLRINGYSSELAQTILKIFDAARRSGVVIEGRIPNPTDANLAYYYETMGNDFRMDRGFIEAGLTKWLPRISAAQRGIVAESILSVLEMMRRGGKTEGMLKNAYVKFMCWFYFKFERVAVALGTGSKPKVLYQGEVTALELQFLSILCTAGCDVVLVQCAGDAAYMKHDPRGELSDAVQIPGAGPFPAGFSINGLYKEEFNRQNAHPAPAQANPPRAGVNLARPGSPAPAQANPPRAGVNLARPGSPAPAQASAPRTGVNLARPGSPAPAQANPPRTGVNFSRPAPSVNINPTPAPSGRTTVNFSQNPQPSYNPRPVASPQRPSGGARPSRGLALRLPETEYTICPNAWITNSTFESMVMPSANRGNDDKLIYTCFARIEGAEDKLTYTNELIQLHQRLLENKRKLMIIEGGLNAPTQEEIQQVRRGNYNDIGIAITDLASNLRMGTALQLQNIAARAFMETLAGEAEKPGANINRIISTATYLICWFRRCYKQLLEGWQPRKLGALIYMGPCGSDREAAFLRMMSRMPVDVLLLCPNLDDACKVQDEFLFVQKYEESVSLNRFPRESSSLRVSTAASHAERELTGTLFSGTGMYRNHQFELAQSITLNTTYDEISIYWDQELKFRPSFNTVNETVMMPVLFAQVSGIKQGDTGAYWRTIKALMTPNTTVVKGFPFVRPGEGGFTAPAVEFFRNGKLQRDKLKAHRQYPFGLLRSEVQDHILNKLQVLIDQRIIRGTFENGTEYQIITTVLNMKKELLRMIQQFDFTKKNPKILCINTRETAATREDAIMLAFLNLVGFDVVCFIPTGYQCVGQWYTENLLQEHQIGDYVYDLGIPDFNAITQNTHSMWNIFRRGS